MSVFERKRASLRRKVLDFAFSAILPPTLSAIGGQPTDNETFAGRAAGSAITYLRKGMSPGWLRPVGSHHSGEAAVIVVTAALALGALDSAQFATKSRKRARQSLAASSIWALGCLFSLLTGHGTEVVTAVLAAFIAFGSVALLIIHAQHGIATPRVWLAPVLALVALIFALVNL